MTDHVLYRMFAADDALLYVGITLRPVDRLRHHSKDKQWWSEVATIRLESFPSRESLEAAERTAIADESPRYNVALNGLPRRRWYSVEQAAEVVCGDAEWPSIRWMHRQIKNGRLSGRKQKGQWRFSDADLYALMDACSNRHLVEARRAELAAEAVS